MLFINQPPLPEITDGLSNTHPGGLPIFPIMFVSIACGAISGFHATQSPLMARCMKSEKYARPVFYGAMITEGIVALIWAAAATYFFHNNGMEENNAAVVVDSITKEWLGAVGGVLAILGVIAAPITSGDTAFRSARLIVADFLQMEQKTVVKRLMICIPMFIVAIGILLYSQKDKDGFDMIWRYFAWSNQTLAELSERTKSRCLRMERTICSFVSWEYKSCRIFSVTHGKWLALDADRTVCDGRTDLKHMRFEDSFLAFY